MKFRLKLPLPLKIIIPLLFLVLLAFSTYLYFFIIYNLPSPYNLKNYKVIPISTHIYDRNGNLLHEVYREQNRTPVRVKDLPPYIYQATIAIEDKKFFKHKGVSIIGGIARAIKDMISTRNLQGGSTLTQQLVKSALLTPERTIQRKLKEIVLAIWTEQIFSKEEILELYLNQVPYGGSSYGVEEAAKTYFHKSAKELSIHEAAFLAGLPQAPTLYSPFINPELAFKRKNLVLKAMYDQKYIDQKIYQKLIREKVNVQFPKTSIKAPHFVFYVKAQLEEQYGVKQVEEGGLEVTTTLDLNLQHEAERILKEELEKLKKLNVSNGAVLITRPPTGEILAMVGSVDYFSTSSGAFNVTTALRQPGSAIKPINYAIGIERKIVSPATLFLDVPTCFGMVGQKRYCPHNYDFQFHGIVPLRFALGNSYNIPAVKMLALNGVDTFVASAPAFLISSFKEPSRYGLSLTLGGAEVRMTELAQAFSAFANGGRPKALISLLSMSNKSGEKSYSLINGNYVKDISQTLSHPNFLAIDAPHAILPETAYLISHILLDNNARSAAFGSSSYLNIQKHAAVAVKTGTTDDKKDNWTIGYTPNFLVVVWVGNNDNTPMHPFLTSGITGAAPIWNKIMTYVLKNQPDLWPVKPESVVGKQVCFTTGELMTKNSDGSESCQSRYEYFIRGTESKQLEVKKEVVPVNRDTGRLTTQEDPSHEMKEKMLIKDHFSTFCIDCVNDIPVTPTPLP